MYFRRIKELREDNDITQKEIANYLKITQQQYSLYENGKRTIPVDFVIMLTKYYSVTSDYILGLSDEPKSNNGKVKNININYFGNVNMN